MPDLADGESVEMKGSGAKPYVLKNVGGVYSCTCPAWRNQSAGIERRTCKHLRKLRGDAAEETRLGGALPAKPVKQKVDGDDDSDAAAGPPLLLAQAWDNSTNLAEWWMSEKLDGVRAYWDGKQFLSRLGNLYHAPDWFVKGLPDSPLDGELWIGRKKFQRTVSVARRQDKTELWKELRFLVFDAPASGGTYEERREFLVDCLAQNQPEFAQPHAHERCVSLTHLAEELSRVEALGGEGLMLRQPGSKYEIGRSFTLLKVKNFHDDEATVLEYQPGKGKFKGKVGALLVKLADGTEFSVGTGLSDRERATPPPIGSLITFRYQELSDAGVPRFPSYVGIHRDGAVIVATAAPDEKPAKGMTEKTPQVSLPAAATKPPSGSGTSIPRYFECTESGASKFWEISVASAVVTVRFGRIGSAGQSKPKTFPNDAAANRYHEDLIAKKTSEGYVEREPG